MRRPWEQFQEKKEACCKLFYVLCIMYLSSCPVINYRQKIRTIKGAVFSAFDWSYFLVLNWRGCVIFYMQCSEKKTPHLCEKGKLRESSLKVP